MKSLFLFAAVVMLSFPGCIAWEIRDEIRAANRQLGEVSPTLAHTLHGVHESNLQVAATTARLAEVQGELNDTQSQLAQLQASLADTNRRLADVHAALGTTQPMLVDLNTGLTRVQPLITSVNASLGQTNPNLDQTNAALKRVEGALGPVSGALGSLGGAVSFLGLGDSSSDVLAEPAPPAEPPPEAPGADAADAPPAAGRPDPILGTWIEVYPEPATPQQRRVLVIMSDGAFLAAEGGGNPRIGRWARSGRALTLTPDTQATPGAGTPGAATPGAARGAPGTPPSQPETFDILTLNSRTLTARVGTSIRVLARP